MSMSPAYKEKELEFLVDVQMFIKDYKRTMIAR